MDTIKCYNCVYWRRGTSWGTCYGYRNQKENNKRLRIVVAGGHSQPDEIITRDIFCCGLFKDKHKRK